MRVIIGHGLFYGGYEPHDMPGAYIVTTYPVLRPYSTAPPTDLSYDGPGNWMAEGAEGAPPGWRAVWLGTATAISPTIVWVSEKATPESDRYDKAYRRGWKATRRPVTPQTATEAEAAGLRQGWADSPNNRNRGSW